MKSVQEELFALQDMEYAAFQSKLVPDISRDTVIGVRIPLARKLAKAFLKEGGYESFLQELPHKYYDENILHVIILSEIKDYEQCVKGVEAFLPYVDNWAVCDILAPKVFGKNKLQLLEKIKAWIASDRVYTIRFGMEMLMRYFLDEDFDRDYLEMPAGIKSDEYYVNMMIAWFFATALAKQWDATIPYLIEHRFEKWVHNKTIQKAIESYRITKEQKEFLKTLRIK